MPVTRRRLLSAALSAGAAHAAFPAWMSARGREALTAAAGVMPARMPLPPGEAGPLFLDSNEDPTGPCPAAAAAIAGLTGEMARYPFRGQRGLVDAIASRHATRGDHLVLGCGSTEILVNAVRAYTSPAAGLLTPAPTFEIPARVARTLGHPVVERPVTPSLDVDLDDLSRHVRAAGLVFLCNPNNPTGTALPLGAVTDFIRYTRRRAPDAVILLDEAYIEYADGRGVASAEAMALAMPNVIVSRTFSKAFGMAGLRVGYAIGQPATLAALQRQAMPMSVNTLALHAARAAVEDAQFLPREVARNAEVRRFLAEKFTAAGCAVPVSHTNFLMVDLKRDPAAFRAGCDAAAVHIGRRFPDLEGHVRISLGTMAELERAWAV